MPNASMTLNVETPRVVYTGSGTRGPFSLSVSGTPITYSASSHIIAERYTDEGVLIETLVEGTDYDLSATSRATGDSAATLTIDPAADALAADEKLVIYRQSPLSQTLALTQGGGFSSSANEENYDKIVRILQELYLQFGRQITINPISSGVDTDLPIPQAGYLVGWNSGANGFANYTGLSTGTIAVTSAWADVIEKSTIALGAQEMVDQATAATLLGIFGAQPLDADLTAIAALGYTSGQYLTKKTAANTHSLITLSSPAETLLAQTTQALMRTTGLGVTASGDALLTAASAAAQRTALADFGKVATQVFTSSGTYTPTSGMLYAIIECVGGGGGGGGCANSTAGNQGGAGGGGGGGYSRKVVTAADVGASKTVTIGAAGSAGSSGNNNGGNGGDTSVGTLCIAKGGSGGGGAPSNSTGGGGSGGVVGTGDFRLEGKDGSGANNGSIVTVTMPAGLGGDAGAGFGFGGWSSVTSSGASSGFVGRNYGGGGGGGKSGNGAGAAPGGAGTAGVVIITEFCS